MPESNRENEAERRSRVGLCSACGHARTVNSARGSEFWLCERSKSDARFNRYPPLPVRSCHGFSVRDAKG